LAGQCRAQAPATTEKPTIRVKNIGKEKKKKTLRGWALYHALAAAKKKDV
jgi:hypothetical protein